MTAWLILLLHAVLVAVAVLALAGVQARVATRRHGNVPSVVEQPARDLRRLWAKGSPVPPGTAGVFAAAPAVAVSAATVALLLVPSFSLGMASAPGADLLLVFALLALPHTVLALGTADGGAAPASAIPMAPWPVLLLVAMAALLLSGGTNLPMAAAAVRDGGPGARAGGALAGAALFALLLAAPPLPDRGFAGRHRALLLAAGWARMVAGLSVVAALALPFGLAPPGAGPGAWMVGAAIWVLKLGTLGIAAASITPRPAMLLPATALLAVMAVVVAGAPGPA